MFDGFKRITGIIITLIPPTATLFGFDTSPDFTGDATEILSAVVQAAGIALTVYGIIKAKGSMWFMKKKA